MYIYSMEYYLAIKKSEELIYATIWMNFGKMLRKPGTKGHILDDPSNMKCNMNMKRIGQSIK